MDSSRFQSKLGSYFLSSNRVFQQYSTKILFSQVSTGIIKKRMEEYAINIEIYYCEHSWGDCNKCILKNTMKLKRVYHSKSMKI